MKKKLNDVLFIAILLGFCFHENLNIFDFIYIFFIINASDIKNNEVRDKEMALANMYDLCK